MTLEEENKELRELLAFFIAHSPSFYYTDKRMKVRARRVLNIRKEKLCNQK